MAAPENASRRAPTKKPPSTVTAVETPMDKKDSPWVATVPILTLSTSDVPVQFDALFGYLSSRKYRGFEYQEADNHSSAGPHTKFGLPVRVFYNDVMVKTHDKSDGGKGWFWYEVTSDTDPKAIAAFGNGVMGCQSCHTIGYDMVKSNTSIIK